MLGTAVRAFAHADPSAARCVGKIAQALGLNATAR
jgi:hypothetical protein